VHPSAPHGGLRNHGQEQSPGTLRPADRGNHRPHIVEEWQRYLDFQSRFHHYSFGNVLLIAAQCNKATWVAGFNAWRKLNRFVRRERRPSGFSPHGLQGRRGRRDRSGRPRLQVRTCLRHRPDRRRRTAVHLQPARRRRSQRSLRPARDSRPVLRFLGRDTNSMATRVAIAAMPITAYGSRRPTHPRTG